MVDVVDVRRDMPAPDPSRAAVPSAWAPLRHTWFRALWIAQFVANTGTWAQTVGAQWLMGDLGGSALRDRPRADGGHPARLPPRHPRRSPRATSSTVGGCC